MSGAQYARLVPKLHRTKRLPKIDRPFRPRMIAWAGPSAFYNNRFYEMDKWYKGRIDKPQIIPKLHIIDPTNHYYSLDEFLQKEKGEVESINIGYKMNEVKVPEKTKAEMDDLERKSRKMELLVDTADLESSSDLAIFKHFNIFDDLFGKRTFFENVQKFDVAFGDNVVFKGNVIAASETTQKPQVSMGSVGKGGFNTLLMVSLDGNAFEKAGELVQWMVANIPDGADLSEGKEIAEYLQPLPFYGTGYHRVAFILFRHKTPLEDVPVSKALSSRILPINEFYKNHENQITPSAISFFQTSYDNSVKDKLHSLDLKSPLYEYEYTEALKPEQKEFPLKAQPFDQYLDMYRDPKEVDREILEERLKRAQLDDYQASEWLDPNYNENKETLPTWQHRRILAREGRYQGLYKNSL